MAIITIKVRLVELLSRVDHEDKIDHLLRRIDIVVGLLKDSRAISESVRYVLVWKVILEQSVQKTFHLFK